MEHRVVIIASLVTCCIGLLSWPAAAQSSDQVDVVAAVAEYIVRANPAWGTDPCIGYGPPASLKAPSAAMMKGIRKRLPHARSADDSSCVRIEDVLHIDTPIFESRYGALVRAGGMAASQEPGYLLRKNWIGRWRVVRVVPVE